MHDIPTPFFAATVVHPIIPENMSPPGAAYPQITDFHTVHIKYTDNRHCSTNRYRKTDDTGFGIAPIEKEKGIETTSMPNTIQNKQIISIEYIKTQTNALQIQFGYFRFNRFHEIDGFIFGFALICAKTVQP